MAFSPRPRPDSLVTSKDASDFEPLTAAQKQTVYDHWGVNTNSVFLVHMENTPLGPWRPLLGAVDDPILALSTLCTDLHKPEFLFLRAFKPTTENVTGKKIGQNFVAPSRLSDGLYQLIGAGLDLSLDGVAPISATTTLLSRINAVLLNGFKLLPLRDIDLLPTVQSPNEDIAYEWPSLVMFGDLVQPADSSLAPASDLIGLLGFRLHFSDREDPTAQYHIVSTAIIASQLIGPMQALSDDLKPALLAERVIATA